MKIKKIGFRLSASVILFLSATLPVGSLVRGTLLKGRGMFMSASSSWISSCSVGIDRIADSLVTC